MEKRNVAFRRVRGRIIPIRLDKKKTLQGTALLGAGIGVGATGGLLDALFGTREASTGMAMSNLKKIQGEFKTKRGFESKGMSNIARKLTKRKTIISKLKGLSGAKFSLATSTLIGVGTEKIIEQFEKKPGSSAMSEIAAGLAGGAVFLGTRTKFARKIAGKLHRFVSNKTRMTSKLDRAFIQKRKNLLNPNQLSLFIKGLD